jgi:2-oxoisovalerate dehydrogenase E1 component
LSTEIRELAPALEHGVTADLYRKAILIRKVEQRLLSLFAEGKLFGTVHTCIGQEFTGVAVAESLRAGDLIFSNHRCHGHFLARTGDVDGLMAELMGRQTGVCGGRGGSQHLCKDGFFSNGIQGGIVPVAAGLAFAQKLQNRQNVSVVFIGDGTLGEGAIYEAMNVASKWDLPLVIVCENNRYSQSTSQNQTLAGKIRDRFEAFGIETWQGDTWHPADLIAVTSEAINHAREKSRPVFIQMDTYRLMAHSKGDDDRAAEELKSFWAKDPLQIFEKEQPETAAAIGAEVGAIVEAAVAKADKAPFSCAVEVDENCPDCKPVHWVPTQNDETDRIVNRIHASFQRNMRRNPRIVMIGEDIEGPYGGAFKVTKNLSIEFPGRVRNMQIAESLIVGMGNGLALNGYLPVCEIMFGDFLALAGDQLINHASKFRYMYNEQVTVPLIVRTPMGGKRGYAATHSQSIEKHFMGLPGTIMLAIHHRYDPALVYDELFAGMDRPAIVIENKLLYGTRISDKLPAGFVLEHTKERFPTTRIRPEGKPDLTILCYGGMLPDVEKTLESLFEEHEIIAEVVCPTQLYPLNPWPIIESVRASGKLLIVEEGLSFAGFSAETVAQIQESAPGILKYVKRLASPRHPIPACGPLEKTVLPGVDTILAAAVELTRHE